MLQQGDYLDPAFIASRHRAGPMISARLMPAVNRCRQVAWGMHSACHVSTGDMTHGET